MTFLIVVRSSDFFLTIPLLHFPFLFLSLHILLCAVCGSITDAVKKHRKTPEQGNLQQKTKVIFVK
jgi:hypothetical protein